MPISIGFIWYLQLGAVMRDISKVIDDMLEAIPKDEADIRARLEYVKYKVPYTAPEAMMDRWHECLDVLTFYRRRFVDNPSDWVERVRRIWTDEESEG
jgi:hypothetical protein